jgi:hypothetical protein
MPSRHAASAALSFRDVLRFAVGYWRRQPIKLGLVVSLLTVASALEAYLPSALSNMLAAVRERLGDDAVA